MLGVLPLIDVTMVANLLTMVIIGGYATFTKLDQETSGPSGMAHPCGPRHHQDQTGSCHWSVSPAFTSWKAFVDVTNENLEHQVENFHSPDVQGQPFPLPIPTS